MLLQFGKLQGLFVVGAKPLNKRLDARQQFIFFSCFCVLRLCKYFRDFSMQKFFLAVIVGNAVPGYLINPRFQTALIFQGLMVREAARMAQANAPEADIIARLERMRDEMRMYWMFDTLEYLAKSGRIGRAARFMGGLLNVKPPSGESPFDNRFLSLFAQSRFGQ